ncbi:small heat shock protein, chloroplastic [Tanacetum coccineum]
MACKPCGITNSPLASNNISKPSHKSAKSPCFAFFPHSRNRSRLASVRAQAENDSSVDVQVSKSQNKGGANSSVERLPSSTISPFGLLDPMSPMRTMRQMLDTIDRMFEDPVTRTGTLPAWNIRSPWDIQDAENEIKMRFDVPGLAKEDLKVFVEDNMLVIKGEHKDGQQDTKGGDNEKIKADLKNGVLLISIPKTKVERKLNSLNIVFYSLPSLGVKTHWDKLLPRKVNIFMWRLKLDRLPHRFNLSSRGIDIPKFGRSLGGGAMIAFLFLILSITGWLGHLHGPRLEMSRIVFTLSSRLLYGLFGGIVIMSLSTLNP